MKVEQTYGQAGGKQTGVFTITQNNGSFKKFASTHYQWGRKDALPGTDTIAQGSYSFDNTQGGRSIDYAIQHPENMFIYAGTGDVNNYNWCNARYDNLWAADNTVTTYNDNVVVKTIYDPCPAGFKMPAANAFTGFTTTGQAAYSRLEFNVNDVWDDGWNFNNKISSPDATIYFPATGFRESYRDGLQNVGGKGFYWTAGQGYPGSGGYALIFKQGQIYVHHPASGAQGLSVRPVSE